MNRPPNKHHSIGNPAVCMKEFGNNLDNLGIEFFRKINELSLHFQSTSRHVESEVDRLKQKVANYNFESKLDDIDHSNAASDTTAKYLLTIAETGICAKGFGRDEVDKAAQAILKLYQKNKDQELVMSNMSRTIDGLRKSLKSEVEYSLQASKNDFKLAASVAFEQAAILAENWGGTPPNPQGRRAAMAADIRALKQK